MISADGTTWLTTFCDFLTLLLCFMLAILCNSSKLNSEKNKQKQALSQTYQLSAGTLATVGKPIASNFVSEYRQQFVSFNAEDFDHSEKALNPQGLSKLSEISHDSLQKIELQICNFGQVYVESLFRQILASRNVTNWELLSGQQACKSGQLQNPEKEQPILLTAWFRNG